MDEIGTVIPKEVYFIFSFENLKPFLFQSNLKVGDEVDSIKTFTVSSQYEQLENDDLYTKYKVKTRRKDMVI